MLHFRMKYEDDAIYRTEDLEDAKWVEEGDAEPGVSYTEEHENRNCFLKAKSMNKPKIKAEKATTSKKHIL